MSTIELALNDIACTSCLGKVKARIKNSMGIEKVTIVSGSGKISINYNEKLIGSTEISYMVKKILFRTFD